MRVPTVRRGETVTVAVMQQSEPDDFGDVDQTFVQREVADVLVAPGATEDLGGDTADDGVKVSFTCYFPKTMVDSLRGGRVCIRGQWFQVIGDPRPWPAHVTPGERNLVVAVTDVMG